MRLIDIIARHSLTPMRRAQPIDDLLIFGATEDSRDVRFGSIFFAISGSTVDGLRFCRQAAERGAQAIAVPAGTQVEALGLNEYELSKIVVLEAADVRNAYARLLADFYLLLPGTLGAVTGTNGKTSTVTFLRDIWSYAGHHALSLGTLGLQARGRRLMDLEAGLTTFDPKTLHMLFGELVSRHGISHVAMEASSHALDQHRLAGLSFDVAGFTNLTQDHLDYHGSMAEYGRAKARLFTERLKPDGVAVINIGLEFGEELSALLSREGRRTITVNANGAEADLALIDRQPHPHGQTLVIDAFGSRRELQLPVAGAFQAENVLCAIGMAASTGVDIQVALTAAEHVSAVPGRLEQVAGSPSGAGIYVDYAHTPDALDNVLKSLRPHVGNGGRLQVVFGCGGDRDRTKRPIMGKIAAERADIAYVTDDNPRSEPADAIRAEVLAGDPKLHDGGDRRRAIEVAVNSLRDGDVLLIAGKGHEDYQIIPKVDGAGREIRDDGGRILTTKVLFSDADEVRKLVHAA